VLVVVADVVAAIVMLAVRHRAPDGGYFHESQRAAGALTVGGTIFAVLVGFVFLLAFQSYQSARSTSQDEALAALGLFNSAEHFPRPVGGRLQGDDVCYARAVINQEWPAMADQSSSPVVDHWSYRMDTSFDEFAPRGTAQSDAAQNWFDESDALDTGRRGRLAEATRVVPTTIWVLLLLTGAAVVGFVVLFADAAERVPSQLALVLAVTTSVAASLLIVNFLDRPYGNHSGAISPAAMRGVLATMEREQEAIGRTEAPCNAAGQPA
jgi:hypothetical protein